MSSPILEEALEFTPDMVASCLREIPDFEKAMNYMCDKEREMHRLAFATYISFVHRERKQDERDHITAFEGFVQREAVGFLILHEVNNVNAYACIMYRAWFRRGLRDFKQNVEMLQEESE